MLLTASTKVGAQYIYSAFMKAIQWAHSSYRHNGNEEDAFVATRQLRTASGGVYALSVVEPTESSTSTKQGV